MRNLIMIACFLSITSNALAGGPWRVRAKISCFSENGAAPSFTVDTRVNSSKDHFISINGFSLDHLAFSEEYSYDNDSTTYIAMHHALIHMTIIRDSSAGLDVAKYTGSVELYDEAQRFGQNGSAENMTCTVEH